MTSVGFPESGPRLTPERLHLPVLRVLTKQVSLEQPRRQARRLALDAGHGTQAAIDADQRERAESLEVTRRHLQQAAVGRVARGIRRNLFDRLRQQAEYRAMIRDIDADRRGQVGGQQAMFLVDLAPGVVPGGLIDLHAQQAHGNEREQDEAQQEQVVDRLGQQTLTHAGFPGMFFQTAGILSDPCATLFSCSRTSIGLTRPRGKPGAGNRPCTMDVHGRYPCRASRSGHGIR